MDKEKADWLKKLNDKLNFAKKQEEQLQRKDAILSQLQNRIRKESQRIYDDMNLVARKRNKDGTFSEPEKTKDGKIKLDPKKEQQLLNYWLRDQTTEFDLDDQQDGFTLTDEDAKKHLEGARVVTELSRMLDEEVDELDEHGNPIPVLDKKSGQQKLDKNNKPIFKKKKLFSDEELAECFYQPLVRQGLVPETFVPDKYSETKKMVDGSFKGYADRLKKEGLKNKIFNKENLTTALTFVSAGMSIVGSAGEFMKAADLKPEDLTGGVLGGPSFTDEMKDGDFAAIGGTIETGFEIVVGDVVEGGEEIYGDVQEGEGENKEKNKEQLKEEKEAAKRVQMAGRLAGYMIATVGAELSKAITSIDPQLSGLAVGLSGAFSAAVKAPTVAVKLAQTPLTNDLVNEALKLIGDGLKKAFEESDPDVGDSKAKMKQAGEALAAGLVTGVNLKDFLTDIKGSQYDKVLKNVGSAVEGAAGKVMKDKAFVKLLTDNATGISAKAEAKMADDFLAEEDKASKESEEELKELVKAKDDGPKSAKLLEKRINKLNRDRAILKWSTTLLGQGIEIASKFIAPLAIAGSALKLALNIREAAKRTIDFVNFVNSRNDMFLAASPYSAPVANFIDNAEAQALHYEACAAIELVNLIGAIVETGGMASGIGAAAAVAVGKTMQATASAMGAIESVLYELKKRYDMEEGWKTYKIALTRKENRKLGLVAMKKNPTLAKYAVAWGAVVQKDPLVGDFMSNCGLDAETLKDPESKLHQVVKYLEARMPDDNVLVGRDVAGTDWEPKKIELTAACWASAKRRAVDKAELVEADTREIELALTDFSASFEELEKKYKPDASLPTEQEISECQTLLNKIPGAFANYKPRRKTGGDKDIAHKQMEVFIKRFTRSVGAKHKTLTRMQKVVKDTPAKCRQKVGDLFTKAKVPCDPKDLPFDLCMDVVEKKSITPAVAYITDPKNKMIPAATLALRIDAQWKVHVNDPSEIFKVFDSKEIIGICGETFKTTWTADYVKQRLGTSA